VPERRDAGLAHAGQLSAESAKELDPGLAVVDDQTERRAHVQPDDEGQEERLGPTGSSRGCASRTVPAADAVAEARDREEFGDALRESHDDGLEVRQGRVHPQR
jgi:hypothetical protein